MLTILLLGSLITSNAQAGEFEVLDFDGFKKEYLTNSAKPVVFNFWATWCKPCVKELPYFIEAAEKHPEWNFVLVSLDFPKQFESRLRPFLLEKKIEVPVVVLNESNANVYIDQIDNTWQGSIPATMIWQNANVGFIENEFHTYEDLISFITQSINQ